MTDFYECNLDYVDGCRKYTWAYIRRWPNRWVSGIYCCIIIIISIIIVGAANLHCIGNIFKFKKFNTRRINV